MFELTVAAYLQPTKELEQHRSSGTDCFPYCDEEGSHLLHLERLDGELEFLFFRVCGHWRSSRALLALLNLLGDVDAQRTDLVVIETQS